MDRKGLEFHFVFAKTRAVHTVILTTFIECDSQLYRSCWMPSRSQRVRARSVDETRDFFALVGGQGSASQCGDHGVHRTGGNPSIEGGCQFGSLPFLVEQAHRFAHTEEGLLFGWRHLLGPHFDTAGLKEAQELKSREELDKPVVAEPHRPHEGEEEAHLVDMEEACDEGPAWEEDEAIEGAPVVSVQSSSSGPEPSPPMMPKTKV